jgi:Spy/CpxP family protein refolding chaperone
MRLGKLALVLGLGLLAAGPALAQPGGGGFGGFGGFGGGGLVNMIGFNKGLQDELKIDADQLKSLTDALAKVRSDDSLKEAYATQRDRQAKAEDRAAANKKINEANEKAVASVLKEAQVKRLHQIENQQAGIGMFNKEEVKTALKLTDAQHEKIDEINKELQKDLRELSPMGGKPGGGGGFPGGGFGGFGDPETQKKRQGLQKEALDNVVKLLKGEQKTTYKDLTGEAFELTFAGPGGGGFGGPGGGGFGGFGGRATPPGTILSTATQDTLKLTADQKKELEVIQKEVDAKLAKLLTADQLKQMKDMATPRGPGGGGRPGGPPGGNPNP